MGKFKMKIDYPIEEVVKLWGINLKRLRPDVNIAGSPDRCRFRSVIEDKQQRLYILENLFPHTVSRKRIINRTLSLLAGKGLPEVNPYLPTTEEESIAIWRDELWQMTSYIPGVALKRPNYAFEGWRGPPLADFLIQLHEISVIIPFLDKNRPFSIVDFFRDFLKKIKIREPDLHKLLQPAVGHLNLSFMEAHNSFPIRFCHGDYHPLNVIWSENGIEAVIDWEFMGFKPELYDVAMLIGFLGMEKPQSLTGDFVYRFIKTLKEKSSFSENSWQFLFEFVLVLRFAWLSDWLRRSDREMVELETVYIQLLLENREIFLRSWGI